MWPPALNIISCLLFNSDGGPMKAVLPEMLDTSQISLVLLALSTCQNLFCLNIGMHSLLLLWFRLTEMLTCSHLFLCLRQHRFCACSRTTWTDLMPIHPYVLIYGILWNWTKIPFQQPRAAVNVRWRGLLFNMQKHDLSLFSRCIMRKMT